MPDLEDRLRQRLDEWATSVAPPPELADPRLRGVVRRRRGITLGAAACAVAAITSVVVVVRSGGSPRKQPVVAGAAPSGLVALTTDGQLVTMTPTGTVERRTEVSAPVGTVPADVSTSADGSVAYATFEAPTSSCTDSVVRVPASADPAPVPSLEHAAVSPDASLVAGSIKCGSFVVLQGVASGRDTRLYQVGRSTARFTAMTWSADGEHVVASKTDESAMSSVWLFDMGQPASVDNPRSIGPASAGWSAATFRGDTGALAVVDASGSRVLSVDPTTGGATTLLDVSAQHLRITHLSFDPTGRRLAFVADDDLYEWSGGAPTRVARGVRAAVWYGGESVNPSPTLPPLPTTVPPPATFEPLGLSFVSASHGWASARRCTEQCAPTLEETRDGGVTWTALPAPPIAGTVRFATATDGYLFGDVTSGATLSATHDGGRTWQMSLNQTVSSVVTGSPDDWAFAATCPANSGGCTYQLYASTDHGRTWQRRALQFTGSTPSAPARAGSSAWVYASSPEQGHGQLWYSADDGVHWAQRVAGCPDGFSFPARLSAVTADDLWLACAGQPAAGSEGKAVLRSADGGQHWTTVALNEGNAVPGLGKFVLGGYLNSLVALSDRVAFIGLDRGTLYVSSDGGATWGTAAGWPGPELFFHDLQFVDATHGWAVAGQGPADTTIYRTTDGGRTWTGAPMS